MTTKVEKIAKLMNDSFPDHLRSYMIVNYDIEVLATCNIFAGVLFTLRKDGKDFTPEQRAAIVAFEDGYLAAMEQVR